MVKFVSKFDESVTKAINGHSLKKGSFLFIFISLLIIGVGAFGAFNSEDPNLEGGIIIMVLGALYYPLVILLTKVFQKKFNKSMSIMSSSTIETFEFYDDYFIIKEDKGEDFQGYTKAKYTYFFKIIKTKDTYFLYQSQNAMHVVPYSTLVEGSIEELDLIFSKNLKDKFKC